MILYHYTSPDHLPLILRSGLLKPTESNVSLTRPHAGPDVVWTTTDPEPDGDPKWAANSFHDKGAIRFTLNLPRRAAQPWSDWAARQGMQSDWKRSLIRTGGPGWRRWHVVQRAILASEWTAITDMRTGEPIEIRTGLTPPQLLAE